MGVIPCDRAGCDHIMCDHYLFGNEERICLECLNELIETWRQNPTPLTPSAVRMFVSKFMSTSRAPSEAATEGAVEEFKRMLEVTERD